MDLVTARRALAFGWNPLPASPRSATALHGSGGNGMAVFGGTRILGVQNLSGDDDHRVSPSWRGHQSRTHFHHPDWPVNRDGIGRSDGGIARMRIAPFSALRTSRSASAGRQSRSQDEEETIREAHRTRRWQGS
jgi:hypothetical protein